MTRIEHVLYRPRIGPVYVPRLVLLLEVLVPPSLLVVLDEDVTLHVRLVPELVDDLLGLAVDALYLVHQLGFLLVIVII